MKTIPLLPENSGIISGAEQSELSLRQSHLAVVAALSVAALGALCQGAPAAAGPSLSGALLTHKHTKA